MEEYRFVQYLALKIDPIWRRLSPAERERGRAEFAEHIVHAQGIRSWAFSTIGLKAGVDLFLWRMSDKPDGIQESTSHLLLTGLGSHMEITHSLIGLVGQSTYVRRREAQEQAIYEQDRRRYLIVYPFSKTTDWYLMSREARQGMMNEHIRVGHEYPAVRQVLVYSTGLDDQEFVVSYETDDLAAFQQLVIALRDTEARRYTLKDTPIFTCIYRPLEETLALLG